MILIVDNFDSFTLNLVDYLHQLKQETKVVRNNLPPQQGLMEGVTGVVLSPGPCLPKDSNYLKDWIHLVIEENIPLLGICLGHQAINEYFGGTLKLLSAPVHGKVHQVFHQQMDIFEGIQSPMDVVRYHSWTINHLGVNLRTQSKATEDDAIMDIVHDSLPIYGIQFHPESILTKYGIEIIKNWLIKSEIS